MKTLNSLIGTILSIAVLIAVTTIGTEAASSPKNISVADIKPTSATIEWTTDTDDPSRVAYGDSSSYGSIATTAGSQKNHSVTITGLLPGTTYNYAVVDSDDTPLSDNFTLTTPYNFGVLSTSTDGSFNSSNSTEMYEKGVRYRTLNLAWSRIETANGVYDTTYIDQIKDELAHYESEGYEVVLSLGVQYTPAWVRSIDANALFKNQYGDSYAPNEPGKNVANTVFNQSVRTQVGEYIDKVFEEFGTDFAAVRAGGGWYGELHYPSNTYNSRVNSFWGYDDNAQGISNNRPSGVAANPVPGWEPNAVNNGTFENTDDGSWSLSGGTFVSDANGGNNALQKVNPGAFSNQTQQDNIPLVVGRSYTVSAWVKSTNPAAPACFQLVRPVTEAEITFQCSGSSTYEQISHTFTAQDTTAKISLLTYDGSATTLTYDDISILPTAYAYDADNSDARAFIDWYRDSLNNYQNWQIDSYRSAGFDGDIHMLYPGYGVRNQANISWTDDAVSYDLSYTTTGIKDGSIHRGEDWEESINQLPTDDLAVIPYTTWIDGTFDDANSDKWHWSPATYLAEVASGSGRELYGENTGMNDVSELSDAIDNMKENNYSGMFWFSQQELFGGTYVSIDEYGDEIAGNDGTAPYANSFSSSGTSPDGQTFNLNLAGIDNYTQTADLQMFISETANFDDVAATPFESSVQYTLASSATETLYFMLSDTPGNTSNVLSLDVSATDADTSDDLATGTPQNENTNPGVPDTGVKPQSPISSLVLLIGSTIGLFLVNYRYLTSHRRR